MEVNMSFQSELNELESARLGGVSFMKTKEPKKGEYRGEEVPMNATPIEVDRIIADIEDKTLSREIQFLAKSLKETSDSYKELDKKKKELEQEVRAKTDELFKAGDEVWTRVIRTLDVLLLIQRPSNQSKFQKDIFFKTLIKRLGKKIPELEQIMKEVEEEATKITVSAPRVYAQTDLPYEENAGDFVKNIGSKLKTGFKFVVDKIKNILPSFDSLLDDIESYVMMDVKRGF